MIVAATGFFDGVHLGHRMVIGKTCALAREKGGTSLIITFWPHPRTVLQLDADRLRLLTSLEEKKAMCRNLGVDDFVVLPFTREFSRMTAVEFMEEYLVGRYGVSALVLGYDHHLGCDDERDIGRMSAMVSSCGITPVRVEDSVAADGMNISSTLIRRTLSEGDVETASAYLGYNYRIDGAVVAGNGIGRTIGFPTANMLPREPLKLIPAPGVYAVIADVGGNRFPGICNIGTRPTLNDGRGQTIETHILGFGEDIYGLDLGVEFISRMRDEARFPSLEELKKQLSKDRDYVGKSAKVAYLCRNKSVLW